MNILVGLIFLGIVISLGQALFSMSSGQGDSGKMVRALSWRIGLSIALFLILMAGWYFGLIEPHQVR